VQLTTEGRLLMGPGPSNVHPRVLRAMSMPPVGHLDPQFIALMNDVQRMLRFVFQTENELTIPVSGTGSAAMESSMCNFIEPGDDVLICENGYFGMRLTNMARRYGANVRTIERTWGEVFTPEEIEAALKENPAKIVGIVHAETSTGALQPMEGIGDIVHANGGMLVADCVTSLGGMPVKVDEWGVDVAYSGTQKCLSVPPGLGPLTVSNRARDVLADRATGVANWYLDLSMVGKYWGQERTYHHTAPINMIYALYESLCMVEEEGLENRWARHRANAEFLWSGLQELGLEPIVPIEYRLPSLTTVRIPQGVDDKAVRAELLSDYNIEIAGGLGIFAGVAWRIGCMGDSSRKENVTLLLGALRQILNR
jgi:alanine-glyoxylate transaminase/serine-glyoxylate transaminase/serine-pyruvate transaminase